MDAQSRNAMLEAELEAELAEHAARNADPEHAGVMAALQALQGDLTDEERETRFVAGWMLHSSYRCKQCQRAFESGDVIHRKRIHSFDSFMGPTWGHVSYCSDCVAKWHPSWLQSRREPVPCPTGCGALVSWWGLDSVSSCSYRCKEILARERRQAAREPRACDTCGNEFTPTRSDARYCSSACRQRAYRERGAGGGT